MSEELHRNPEFPVELPYRRVLDFGFVALVDVMGDDAAVVQAARVSYGKGTKTVRGDKALISYLMRHFHSTPSEMVEFKFLVRLPVFVARQWIRHRTACLAGDTVLSFDLPGAKRRGRRQHLGRTIAELHRLWHEGAKPLWSSKRKPACRDRVVPDRRYSIPELSRLVGRREETLRTMVRAGSLPADREGSRIHVWGRAWHEWAATRHALRVPMRDRLRRMRLRSCNEVTGEIEHTEVRDIWQSGVKPVFRVTLENGYQLKMSRDHRCLTERGWMTLGEATGLTLASNGAVTWAGDAPAFAVNGERAHRSSAWLRQQREAGRGVAEIAALAGVSYHTIRKVLKRHGLQYTASERARLSGRAQAGQRRTFRRRPLTPQALASIRAARSGPRSNFWKGGITPERQNVGRWTVEHARRVHERNALRCVVCGSGGRLHAHHIDPVWNNEARARDETNLTTLCRRCHSDLHRRNLELEFLRACADGASLAGFWARHGDGDRPRPAGKRRPPVRRLVRDWSRIARIEYAGEEMTYDVEVEGPFHNFVANGFVVHNSVNEYSGRYSEVPDRFWAPSLGMIAEQDTVNRQGRTDALRELALALPEPLRATSCRYVPGEPAVLVAGDGTGISRGALLVPAHRIDFAPRFRKDAPERMLPTESQVWWTERLLEFFPERRQRLEEVRRGFVENNERGYALYLKLLDGGVAREVARCVLPLTMYTEWYWKIDLHNLFHFLRLRMDAHAQLEIRAYAEAMAEFVKPVVPYSWEAFEQDRLKGTFLSADETAALRPAGEEAQLRLLAALHERGYRERRLREVCRKLDIDERLVDRLLPGGNA